MPEVVDSGESESRELVCQLSSVLGEKHGVRAAGWIGDMAPSPACFLLGVTKTQDLVLGVEAHLVDQGLRQWRTAREMRSWTLLMDWAGVQFEDEPRLRPLCLIQPDAEDGAFGQLISSLGDIGNLQQAVVEGSSQG
jgi:hypothetical protein